MSSNSSNDTWPYSKSGKTAAEVYAERPCKECRYYDKTRYLKCSRKCNFTHDSFERDETESRRKLD